MVEPPEARPSMRKSEVWPLSVVETVLVAVFVYLVLLIGLAKARRGTPDLIAAPVVLGRPAVPAQLAAAERRARPAVPGSRVLAGAAGLAGSIPDAAAWATGAVDGTHGGPTSRGGTARRADPAAGSDRTTRTPLAGATAPVGGAQRPPAPSCVTAATVAGSYAGAPGVEQPMAFGPPVEPTGPLAVAEINGELWRRLCGGVGPAGGPYHGPDRRLFLAIDAAANGRDPNRAIARAEWAAGVDQFIVHDAQWDRARVVTETVPAGTDTYAMQVRPGADPLVIRTALIAPSTSRYLLFPVRTTSGSIVTLTLRLPCGFQPIL